jgi:hypothetical protein
LCLSSQKTRSGIEPSYYREYSLFLLDAINDATPNRHSNHLSMTKPQPKNSGQTVVLEPRIFQPKPKYTIVSDFSLQKVQPFPSELFQKDDI